jgi:Zn-dependent peptidase ImmA (M78 family)
MSARDRVRWLCDEGSFEDFGASRVIIVNQYDPPLRRRFTIAHELGHFFLHKSREAPLYAHRDEGSRSREEEEADRFALYLLVPEGMLRHASGEVGRKFGPVPSSILKNLISDMFQVSLPEARQRLAESGLSDTP